MSKTNQSMAFSISNLDDDDLCLDLDDDLEKHISNPITSKKVVGPTFLKGIKSNETESANLCKKTAIQLLDDIEEKKNGLNTKDFLVTNNENDDEDDLLASQVFDKLEKVSQNVFSNYNIENKDEDDEDNFIRSQPIFASTQKFNINKSIQKMSSQAIKANTDEQKTSKNLKALNDASNTKETISITNSTFSDMDSIVSVNRVPTKTQQQISEPSQKPHIETEIKNKENVAKESVLLQIVTEQKVWNFARNEFKSVIDSIKLNFLDYSINYYFKRFFEYDLLMRISESNVRKLPILCVRIKEITRKNSNAAVLLTDNDTEIKGTLSSSITKENWSCFMVGTALILQDVSLMRVNSNNKNYYHVNISSNNLTTVFYPNLENPEIVNNKEFRKFDLSKIKQLIEDFEKTYTRFDYLKHLADNTLNKSTQNKSQINKNSNTSSNSGYTKPAPYQVPNRSQTLNVSNNSTSSNQPKPAQQPQSSYLFNQQSKINNANSNNSSRTFQFKNSNQNNQKITNSTILDISKQQQLNKTANPALTDEYFSQLIFGIEDELLED